MDISPIISQKIADLYLEERNGFRHTPPIAPAAGAGNDNVEITDTAHSAGTVATAIASDDGRAQASHVASLRKQVVHNAYVVTDKLAEEIARRILQTII